MTFEGSSNRNGRDDNPPNQNSETSTQLRSREETARELGRSLGPEYVAFRQGAGSKVPYLEGHYAITLANEIFGFDGWSSEVRDRKVDFMDEKSGKICCSVVMRVTCKEGGAFREDVGYGTVMRGSNIVQDLEKAGKEACTDALKRVLRQFGNSLGNCLYSKSYMDIVRRVPRSNDPFVLIDDLRRPKRARARSPQRPHAPETLSSEPPKKKSVPDPRTKAMDAPNANPTPIAQSTPQNQASLAQPPNHPLVEPSSSPIFDPQHDAQAQFLQQSARPVAMPAPAAAPVAAPEPAPKPAPVAAPKPAPVAAPKPVLYPEPHLQPSSEPEEMGEVSFLSGLGNEFDANVSLGSHCRIDQSTSYSVVRR